MRPYLGCTGRSPVASAGMGRRLLLAWRTGLVSAGRSRSGVLTRLVAPVPCWPGPVGPLQSRPVRSSTMRLISSTSPRPELLAAFKKCPCAVNEHRFGCCVHCSQGVPIVRPHGAFPGTWEFWCILAFLGVWGSGSYGFSMIQLADFASKTALCDSTLQHAREGPSARFIADENCWHRKVPGVQ